MLKCQNLNEDALENIASDIAEAFLAQKGAFNVLSLEEATSFFKVIIETCYKCGRLYTTSENHEAYVVYWKKREHPSIFAQIPMLFKLIKAIPIKSSIALMNNQEGWMDLEKRFKGEKDYLEIFLLCVKKAYQGQGYFRKVLEEIFTLAEKEKCLCILDTDSELKKDKYVHLGMEVVDYKVINDEVTMYALKK